MFISEFRIANDSEQFFDSGYSKWHLF